MKARTILLGLMLLPSFCAIAVPARAQTSDADFQQAVAAYQQSPSDATAEKVIRLAAAMEQLPPIPEEARRHFISGTALFKDAKSPDDYKQVVYEFTQTTNRAPWWPEARYNFALAQEAAGDYNSAIANVKLYLLFKLSEADARGAQDKIYALEAKQRKAKAKVDATNDLFAAFGFTGKPGPVELRQRGSVSEYEVRTAIENGADVNSRNFTGNTILSEAVAISCQANIVQLLLEHGADARDGQALLSAVGYCGDADIAKILIDKGANVNAKESDGKTALMWTAQMAELDLVRLLLKNGAEVNNRDNRGRTALRRLLEDGGNGFWNDNRKAQFERDKPEVVRLLRQAGAEE
jgi:hypothetical protein